MNIRGSGKSGPSGKSRASAALFLLLAALCFACLTLISCKANIETTRHIAMCTTCSGSGVFGRGKCPTCMGIGFTKVSYSYPVIAPGKTYPDDR